VHHLFSRISNVWNMRLIFSEVLKKGADFFRTLETLLSARVCV
jgi:hypothetical protein